jgi:hypothetical protein
MMMMMMMMTTTTTTIDRPVGRRHLVRIDDARARIDGRAYASTAGDAHVVLTIGR